MVFSDPLVQAFARLARYDGEPPKEGDPLLFLAEYMAAHGVDGDYEKLANRPAIDGATLEKDSTAAGLGLAEARSEERRVGKEC
jgi:hypothetical protein